MWLLDLGPIWGLQSDGRDSSRQAVIYCQRLGLERGVGRWVLTEHRAVCGLGLLLSSALRCKWDISGGYALALADCIPHKEVDVAHIRHSV
jgi:hypothetical protein